MLITMFGFLNSITPQSLLAQEVCDFFELEAETLRVYPAADADQGAAANNEFFYAVDNYVIAKHRRGDGELVKRWSGESHMLLEHINSCYYNEQKLFCANSNYSTTPLGSSVEVFDANTLEHLNSHSLGMTEEGSLTWYDKIEGGWIAAFVHYGGKGGLPYKDASYSSLVTFDENWRRTGGWLFPIGVVERMAPYGASGGAIGPDGFLYVTGHDLPEMYVFGKPKMGPYLIHFGTIAIDAEGQAFSWADDGAREIFAVNRRADSNSVLHISVPDLEPDCHAGSFSSFR